MLTQLTCEPKKVRIYLVRVSLCLFLHDKNVGSEKVYISYVYLTLKYVLIKFRLILLCKKDSVF